MPLPPMTPILMSLAMFYELQQHPVSARGMNERDLCIMGATARGRVNQPRARFLKAPQGFFDIVHANGNVMNPFAAFCDEFFDRRFVMKSLDELDAAVANRKHGHAHALIFNVFGAGNLQPKYLVDF